MAERQHWPADSNEPPLISWRDIAERQRWPADSNETPLISWRDIAERQRWPAESNEPPLLHWVRLVRTVTVTVFWGATPQAVMDTDVSQKLTASMLTVEATRLYTGTTCTASAEVIPTFACKEPASLTNHTKSGLVNYKACCSVTSSVFQGGFVRNQSGLKRHPVCSSVGASCRNKRIFCARKAVLLLLVWAARKDQFAALSDRIMNLNVSCRKRFLLASERRIVGRVRADRIIGFVFRAVLGIMPR